MILHITKDQTAFCNVLTPNKAWLTVAAVGVAAWAFGSPLYAASSSGHGHHNHRKPCVMNKSNNDARAEFKAGNAALEAKKFADAIAAFDRAIAAIGAGYIKNGANVVDDTGMKLVLAQSEQKRGTLATAANLKSRVVESRLSLLETSHGCTPK
jgi:hypothetical protein